MSISKIRELFDKKGCQFIVGIAMVLVIVGLLYNGSCRGLTGSDGDTAASGANGPVVTVGDLQITGEEVMALSDEARRQNPNPVSDPQSDFFAAAQAIEGAISRAAIAILAKKYGIDVNEATVAEFFKSQRPQMVAGEKERLVQAKKLKAGATDAEFEKVFATETKGKTIDQALDEQLKGVLDQLKDPAAGPQIKSQLSAVLLNKSLEAKQTATVDQLKESYTTYNVKRIVIADPRLKPEEKKALADKALAEVKAGGKMEDVGKKYAKDFPVTTTPLNKSMLEGNAAYKYILDMKPGQVSDVTQEGGAYLITQLADVKPSLPPDFEKNKAALLTQFKQQQASKQLQKEVEEITKGSSVVFKEPIYEIARNILKSAMEAAGGGDMGPKMKTYAEEAAKATPKDPFGVKLKSLARYSAFEAYFAGLKGDEQKAAREERSEILTEILANAENTRIRLEQFDNLVALEKYEDAGAVLLTAATNNAGTDPASITSHGDIEQKTNQAEKDGKVSKEAIAAVRKELKRWQDERVAEEKQKAVDEKASKESSKSVDDELKKLNDPEALKKAQEGKK